MIHDLIFFWIEEDVVKSGKNELEKQEDELTVAKDISSDSGEDDVKIDKPEDQVAERADKKEETAERESDETKTDGDEGSMFGSIWSGKLVYVYCFTFLSSQ